MSAREFPQMKKLGSPAALRERCAELGIDLAVDDHVEPAPDGPLARPLVVTDGSAGSLTIGNRFCVLPMEGWDGTDDGRPTDLVRRRWRRFGAGGAKLVWGGEAVAVRHDGRANPHQLRIGDDTWEDLAALRAEMVEEHAVHHGRVDDLVVGLQLTHSGRWSRPDGPPAPRVAYRHPLLDRRVPVDDHDVLTDDDLDRLADDFVSAAELAHRAGFAFVDVKACHGYLGHELLSAVDRPGRYGGDLEGRSAFLRRVITGIRSAVPDLAVGVRLSAVDIVPHRADADGRGEPEPVTGHYPYAFGGDGTGLGFDLTEPLALLDELAGLGVGMVCVTAASPYYAPHAQRPAWFPPSDGYRPPRDPLVDVAALLDVAAAFAAARPDVAVVGSGWSYLQDWLAHVAQPAVVAGRVHSIGLGRMALSYPELPADVLAGRALERRLLCRTFSDCTTAPRHGLVSGCYPLDPFYKDRPERVELAAIKRRR